jgi:hypothetical protein
MSKVILDTFGKRVSAACADPARLRQGVGYIQRYFDRVHQEAYAADPGKRVIFTHADQDSLFNFLGFIPEEVNAALDQITDVIRPPWRVLYTPFVVMSVMVIRELTIQNKKREAELFLMFLAFKFFSSRQRVSFPYEPNANIMAYTINHLSDKFKYKKLQNNYNVVKDTAVTAVATYDRILREGNDEMLIVVIPQLQDRIAKILNAIASEFYKNRESKAYLNTERSFDEEGETVDKGNVSANIHALADGVTHDFLSQKVNMGLVRLLSQKNDLPFTTCYQTLTEIRSKEPPDTLRKFTTDLLEVVGQEDKTIYERVCSREFAAEALRQIAVSNTGSEELLRMKDTLDRLMKDHCQKYLMSKRQATRMAYRNFLYGYFVYLVVIHKCK